MPEGSSAMPGKRTLTGDQLYEEMMDSWKGELSKNPEAYERIEPIIRAEAYDPAIVLAHDTTACPSWCSAHDDTGNIGGSAPHIRHTQKPPQVIEHRLPYLRGEAKRICTLRAVCCRQPTRVGLLWATGDSL